MLECAEMKGNEENRDWSKIRKCPNCGKRALKGGNIGLESSGPIIFKTGGVSLAMTFARACWNCGHITLKVNAEE
jgi:ribosomal protein L32